MQKVVIYGRIINHLSWAGPGGALVYVHLRSNYFAFFTISQE